MEREGTAVTCDGRLFHRRAAATGNALSPTVDRRVLQTSRDVDEPERSRYLILGENSLKISGTDGVTIDYWKYACRHYITLNLEWKNAYALQSLVIVGRACVVQVTAILQLQLTNSK